MAKRAATERASLFMSSLVSDLILSRSTHGRSYTRSVESRVTVSRTSPDDIQQRQIIVKLDGKRLGELMSGDEISRVVEPGKHRLNVDNTWNWKNVDFTVAPGEHVRFQTVNRGGRFTWFLVGTLGVGPMYVHIERVPDAANQAL
jgi:hypothetical protein